MVWPSENSDTVLYGEREFIADSGVALRMLLGTRLDIFGTVYLNGELLSQSTEPGFANNSVTDAMLVDIPQNTIKGRVSAGSGDPENLNTVQLTALLNLFSLTLKGLVPPPGTSTGKYLKDDGTWEQPNMNTFTTTVKGLVPPPVTSTGKYLKDDGTWTLIANTPTTYFGSAAWTTGIIAANGGSAAGTVTVTNAAVGDVVTAGFTPFIPTGNTLTAQVSAANIVTCTMVNHTGSSVGSTVGTLNARVWKNV